MLNPLNKNLSIIIPIYNEESNIPFLIRDLNQHFEKHFEIKFEVIFVCDGCEDNSYKILKNIELKNCIWKIIKFSQNYGSHLALRAGILKSQYDYVTFKYADMQESMETIHFMYDKILQGYDVVWGIRKEQKIPWHKKTLSRIYSLLMKKLVMGNFPNNGVDLVIINNKIKNLLNQSVEKHSPIFLQILSFGPSQGFIEYIKVKRKTGKSKWTASKNIKLLIDSIVSFSYRPIRLVGAMGIGFSLIGLIWLSWVLYHKIVLQNLVAGWATLNSILLIGFGVTNISLAVIAEYLWRTLDASLNRKPFVIDEEFTH